MRSVRNITGTTALSFCVAFGTLGFSGRAVAQVSSQPPEEKAAAPSAVAQPTASERTVTLNGAVLSLDECLRRAELNYPKVQEAIARLHAKESQLSEAHRAPFGEFTVNAGVGVIPSFRGNSVYSATNANLGPNLSPAYQVGFEGLIPIWTFGKITNYWSAAGENVKVGKQEVQKEKNQIRFEVRRAYYGVLLARDALALIREARGVINEFQQKKAGSSGAAEAESIEELKLAMQAAELDARYSEAEKNERIALAGLRFFTGESRPIDVVDKPLAPIAHQLGPASRYLQAARIHRPEINMVQAGITARKALLAIEEARYFPDLGVGLTAKWVSAPGVTDQSNPFSYDPYNYAYAAAGLVFRWKLDFLPQHARVERARAELEEMRATERFALGGVGVEVEKAYAEAVDAKTRLAAWSKATQFAKRWLIQVQQGQELGLTEEDDLVEPAKEYALKRFSEMSATFDYNVALAQLAVATGWDELASGSYQ